MKKQHINSSCFTGESLRTETRVAVDVILASCAVLTDVGTAVVDVVVTVATAVALTTLAPVNDDVTSTLTQTYHNGLLVSAYFAKNITHRTENNGYFPRLLQHQLRPHWL